MPSERAKEKARSSPRSWNATGVSGRATRRDYAQHLSSLRANPVRKHAAIARVKGITPANARARAAVSLPRLERARAKTAAAKDGARASEAKAAKAAAKDGARAAPVPLDGCRSRTPERSLVFLAEHSAVASRWCEQRHAEATQPVSTGTFCQEVAGCVPASPDIHAQ